MKPNLKSARDSLMAGGAFYVVAQALSDAGLADLYAVAGAAGATFLVARAYRALRKRWAWLNDFDPASS